MTPKRHTRIDAGLGRVRDTIRACLEGSSLRPLSAELCAAQLGGKMLRARLMLRVGAVAGAPRDGLTANAAAVEMLHAASLLHDDVIDGADRRRGRPAFWINHGASGAVLLGDLLMCEALRLVAAVPPVRLLHRAIHHVREICDAEAEQELLLRRTRPDWDRCVSIARRKTGSLFAFAAYAAGGDEEAMADALCEAGYLAGTAYQLADDILDAFGNTAASGKTLGCDARAEKVTAISCWKAGGVEDPAAALHALCAQSARALDAWPRVARAWAEYLDSDLCPAIECCVASFAATSRVRASAGSRGPSRRRRK